MKRLSKAQRQLYRLLRQFGKDEEGALTFVSTLTGRVPNATFSITQVDGNTDLIAPYGGAFRATGYSGFKTPANADLTDPVGDVNDYDRTQHYITHYWTFGDASYTPLVTPNIPTAWRNLNVGLGKQVTHIWNTPGTYTVTCFAVDTLGNWGVATTTVTVNSADSLPAFAGAGTIVWSQASNWTGEPSGATRCTTIAEVHTAIRARLSGGNANFRVLMRAGETFDNVWQFRFDTSGGADSGYDGGSSFDYRGVTGFYFGRFGTGANPIISYSNHQTSTPLRVHFANNNRQLIFDNLDFRGDWDSTTETGNRSDAGFIGFARCTVIINRCKWRGFGNVPFETDGNSSRWIIAQDGEIRDWHNYGVFTNQYTRFGMVGFDIYQPSNALSGIPVPGAGALTYFFGILHGPFRSGPMYDFYMSQCRFFPRGGWSPASDGSGVSVPPTADQPAARFMNYFSGNNNLRRTRVMIERCVFEGGIALGPTQYNDAKVEDSLKNCVMDTCLVVGSCTQGFQGDSTGNRGPILSVAVSGFTMRNCYIYRPGVASVVGDRAEAEIQIRYRTNTFPTDIGGVEIYNNTFLVETLGADFDTTYAPIIVTGNPPAIDQTPPAGYLKTQNNIIRVVNAFPPAVSTDYRNAGVLPLSTTALAGYTPSFAGTRWNFRAVQGGSVTALREGGTGTVNAGEWVRINWPNIAGQNRGSAPASAAAFRAAVIANSTQKHFVSTSSHGAGFTDIARWPGSRGGVTLDFTDPTFFRIQNNTGAAWSTGDIRVLFDLSDILMPLDTTRANPSTIPVATVQSGSSGFQTGVTTDGLLAQYDAALATRGGKRRSDGTFQAGSPSQGWREA